MASSAAFSTMFLHLALLAASAAREIKVVNNCSQELWRLGDDFKGFLRIIFMNFP